MRKLLSILLLVISLSAKSQIEGMFATGEPLAPPTPTSDSIVWAFSATSKTISGARNLYGDPGDNVLTDNAPNGWSITTVNTGHWVPYTSSPFNNSVDDLNATNSVTKLSGLGSNVSTQGFFTYSSAAFYDVNKPMFRISGLNTSVDYEVTIAGCRGMYTGFDANPVVYTIIGATTNQQTGVNQSVSTATNSQAYTVTIKPDASGYINLYANITAGSSIVAFVYAVKIKSLP